MNAKRISTVSVLCFALSMAFPVSAELNCNDAWNRVSNRSTQFVKDNKTELAKVAALIVGWELTKYTYRRWIAPNMASALRTMANWFDQKGSAGHGHTVTRAHAPVASASAEVHLA